MISEVEGWFVQELNVSRETLQRLDRFADLLCKWNPKINLVSKSSIEHLWERHVLDSAQLLPLIPTKAKSVLDIGTGGGFPGLVLAILMAESQPSARVAMVESDHRKCVFLRTVLSQLGLSADVHSTRVEKLEPIQADILTSRAMAPLEKLLSFAYLHLAPDGQALFLKGASADMEVNEALASWRFGLQKKPSKTSPDAVVLDISNLRPR